MGRVATWARVWLGIIGLVAVVLGVAGCALWDFFYHEQPVVWSEDFSHFAPGSCYLDSSGCLHADQVTGTLFLTGTATYCRGRCYLRQACETEAFTAEFDFRITKGDAVGADGLCFCFVRRYDYPTPGSNPVSNSGEWLDFEGADGYAIELDTYRNNSDPDGDCHIALVSGSARNHIAYSEIPSVDDDAWHHVRIGFSRGSLQVCLDTVGVLETSIVGFDPFPGFFGFTGATGAYVSSHEIDNIEVRGSLAQVGHAPTSSAGSDLYIELGGEAQLDASGSLDLDGDSLHYEWKQIDGPVAVLSDEHAMTPRFAPEIGGVQYVFQLVVSDGLSSSEPDLVVVNVLPDMVWPLLRTKPSGPDPDFYRFGSVWTKCKCAGEWKKHVGADLEAEPGDPVRAVAGGVVAAVFDLGPNRGYGIAIEHLGFLSSPRLDVVSQYLHVVPEVTLDTVVEQGDRIGTVADTDVDHLHFGLRLGSHESSLREYGPAGGTSLAHRGALPVRHGGSDYDAATSSWTYCKSDPLYPEAFLDPWLFDY
jgi:hypothetical protein